MALYSGLANTEEGEARSALAARVAGIFLCLTLLFAGAPPVAFPAAQKGCEPPEALKRSSQRNIFDDRQEADLGDAIAEHLQRTFLVIDDDQIAAYLQRVGERIIKQLAPSNLRFQFFLIDLPEPTAFAIAGGRVYVSRKLVALTKSEDELAGAIAHELGHLVTHQGAIEMTASFAKVLNVKQAGNRQDIFEKYHDWIENLAKDPGVLRTNEGREDQHQLTADQIALYAMVKAGYRPEAFADLFDRLVETKGRTGNWLTDFFGTTRPESKRLRELLKTISALPPACVGPPPSTGPEAYQRWQSEVIEYTGLGNREELDHVLSRRELNPPLEDDISFLRFSPDGKYLLAQNSSSIYVLSREPFEALFRIDAPDSFYAHFTPDSKSVVFHNASLRVEWWDIGTEQRTGAFELISQTGCWQTALSPDGRTLACLGKDFSLSILDVPSGKQLFEKKEFYSPESKVEVFLWTLAEVLSPQSVQFVHMGFSPDARYFVAARGSKALAIDLGKSAAPVSLNGQLKRVLGGGFTFLGSDQVAGIDEDRPKDSALMKFPGGELVDRLPLLRSNIAASGDGRYLLISPAEQYALGVFDPRKKTILMGNKRAAFDIYDHEFVSERANGELGLFRTGSDEPIARANLPRSPLGYLPAVALSPDLLWLAVSSRDRGAVWNLQTGERVLQLREFRGAWFARDDSLYADFPKYGEMERKIGKLDPLLREGSDAVKIDDPSAQQFGKYLVATKPSKKDGSLDTDIIIEVRGLPEGEVLWSRAYSNEAPAVYSEPRHGTLTLVWSLNSYAARKEIKKFPALRQRLSEMGDRQGDYLVEVDSLDDGRVLGALLVETGKGSFRIRSVSAAGNSVVITDTQNRVVVYSLKTGSPIGRAFGIARDVSEASRLLCVGKGSGQLVVYDLATMAEKQQLVFSSDVSHAEFDKEGKRLVVLTANQWVYTIDVSADASSEHGH